MNQGNTLFAFQKVLEADELLKKLWCEKYVNGQITEKTWQKLKDFYHIEQFVIHWGKEENRYNTIDD